MAWDFETDPEFQEELDWVADFVREEIEPLEFVIRHGYDMTDPVRNALIQPLQEQVKERGLWACHLGPELGGQGYGQVKLGAAERDPRPRAVGADRVRLPGARLRQRRDPRPLRHAGAEAAVPRAAARQRDRLVLLDDRAAGRRRPEGVHHPRRAGRRRVGDQRREVVLVARQLRVVPHRHGGHRSRQPAVPADVDVHRPDRHARRRDRPQRRPRLRAGGPRHPRLRALHRRARAARPHARRPGRRVRRRADPARRRAHPPRDAHRRPGAEGVRHDVRAGRVAHHPGRDARPQADGAGR